MSRARHGPATAVLALLALVALLGALATPARAQDYEPGDVRAAAQAALGSDGPEAARRVLEAHLEPGRTLIHARHVEAARAALDLLPPDAGNAVAARFLDASLSKSSGRRDAWQLAVELVHRIENTLDAATGPDFFRRLTDIYPDQIAYRYYLADLYRDLGRPIEARKEYEHILRAAEGETRAELELATLDERAGDVDAALERCDRLLERSPDDLRVLARRVWLLSGTPRRHEEALATARHALEIVPQRFEPGADREEWRAHFEGHVETIESAWTQHRELRKADRRLSVLLMATLAAWAAALGGGLVFLRRRGWI